MISTRDLRFGLIAAAILATSPGAVAAPGANFVAQAEEALGRGDGIAAEVAVEQAVKAGVSKPQLAAFAGEAMLLQGDAVAARSWLEPGAFSDPTRERGFRALARLEIGEGDLDAATRAYDRALQGGQGSAQLWVDIGRLRYRSGQHHMALQAAIRAAEIGPDEPAALEFRGQLLRDAKGPVAALPWFERALQATPDNIELLGEYAATLAEAGRNTDMLAVARHMVEVDPHHPRAYFLQAVLAARAGHDTLARRLLERTKGAYDDVPAGRLLDGILELRIGDPELAADQFEALTVRQADNAEAALLLGRALLASGDAKEVVARFGPAADRVDASPYLLTLVGRAHEHLGQRERAAPYLDRAAAPHPPVMSILAVDLATRAEGAADTVPRLRRLLAAGRRSEAVAMADQLRRRYPGSADVEILTGDVALLAGNPEHAFALYSRGAQIRRNYSLVERMVMAQLMLGREQAAKALLADYIANNPRSAAAPAMYGRLAAQEGDWRTGGVMLRHARELGLDGDPRVLTDLADAELRLGATPAAHELAMRAYGLQRANGHAASVLARILRAGEGEQAAADALLAKARQSTASPVLARR